MTQAAQHSRSYRRTTEEEQASHWLQWYWRHLRALAACAPRRTLDSMMRTNRQVRAER